MIIKAAQVKDGVTIDSNALGVSPDLDLALPFNDQEYGLLSMTKNMVYYRTMIRLNIAEAKTHLSRHLERVERGEVIILCRRNVPIAEIRALPQGRSTARRRPVGVDPGLVVPDTFFDPLPVDLLEAFEGSGP